MHSPKCVNNIAFIAIFSESFLEHLQLMRHWFHALRCFAQFHFYSMLPRQARVIILSTLRTTFLTASCRNAAQSARLADLPESFTYFNEMSSARNAIWLTYLIIYYPRVLLPLKFLKAECGRVAPGGGWKYFRMPYILRACMCALYRRNI